VKAVPGSTGDCVICGQDQLHRAMCYVGLSVCCGQCEDQLEKEVAAELRGDVEAAERERAVITDHPFTPTSSRTGCGLCRAPRSLHTTYVSPLGREAWI
jgi:hypothetical protein